MSTLSLSARPRTLSGRHLGTLRRAGAVPAVVYGHRQQPQSLEIDVRSLERLWHRAGRSTLVDLEIDGGPTRKVLIREVQFNKRTGVPIHADFYAPNLMVVTAAEVPVVLVGEAPAVELNVGQLLQVASGVRVEALPAALPTQITADVSGLEVIDAQITAGDLVLPAGVVLLSDAGEVVAKIAGRRARDLGETEEEAEGEAPEGAGETAAEGEEGA